MRKLGGFAFLVLTGVFVTAPAWAEINCNQVRRYAETGRSADDIAMTMVIKVEQVKKCLEEKGAKKTPAANDKPGAGQ